MEVQIQISRGADLKIPLPGGGAQTIIELKTIAFNMMLEQAKTQGLTLPVTSIDQMDLTFKGQSLVDHHTLHESKVTDGSFIRLDVIDTSTLEKAAERLLRDEARKQSSRKKRRSRSRSSDAGDRRREHKKSRRHHRKRSASASLDGGGKRHESNGYDVADEGRNDVPGSAPQRSASEESEGQADVHYVVPEHEEATLMKMMGFTAFDTTKDKDHTASDAHGIKTNSRRKYRQFMNRVGGFNRNLDKVY